LYSFLLISWVSTILAYSDKSDNAKDHPIDSP
jgi:hypothetical protein